MMRDDDDSMEISPGSRPSGRIHKPTRRRRWQDYQLRKPIPPPDPESWINIDIPRTWLSVMRATGRALEEQLCLALSDYDPNKRGVRYPKTDLGTLRVKLPGELALQYRDRKERQVLLRAIEQYVESLECKKDALMKSKPSVIKT